MFEKNVMRNALENAFDAPIEVTYWDNETEKYGNNDSRARIKINEKLPLDGLVNTPTLTLAEWC